MKKLLILTILILLVTPSLTHAAFDDSRFTTGSVVEVGAYTLDIIGTSTSIVVNDTNLVATLESGSSVTISSATRNQLMTDIIIGVTNTCNSSASSVAISGATTVTVTPTETICVDATPPPVVTPIRTSSSGGSRVTYIPPLSTTTVPTLSTTTTYTFTRDLTVGITGTDVKKLQQFLNSKGYNVTKLGEETTYFGAKTRQALAKFQKDNNITPAIGYFGPVTRTLINKLLNNIIVPTTTVTPIPSTASIFTRDLTLGSEGDDVTRLQTILNTQGYLTVSPTGYFGNLTLQAVKEYQKANNITPVTGYVGPITRGRLSK